MLLLYYIIFYFNFVENDPDLPSPDRAHCLKFSRHVGLLERASPQPECCLVRTWIGNILLLYPGRSEVREVRSYNYNYVIDYDSVLHPLSLLLSSLSSQQIKFQIAVKTIIFQIIFLNNIYFVVFSGVIWEKNQNVCSVTLI